MVNVIVVGPEFDTARKVKLEGELKVFYRCIQSVTREELSDPFPDRLDEAIVTSLPKSGIVQKWIYRTFKSVKDASDAKLEALEKLIEILEDEHYEKSKPVSAYRKQPAELCSQQKSKQLSKTMMRALPKPCEDYEAGSYFLRMCDI